MRIIALVTNTMTINLTGNKGGAFYALMYSHSSSFTCCSELSEEMATNIYHTIPAESDAYWPEAIRFETIDNIDDIISIEIKSMGNQYIIPIILIKALCKIVYDREYFTIILPIELLFDRGAHGFIMMGHIMSVEIRINSNINTQYNLIGKRTYYETSKRRDIAQHTNAYVLKQYVHAECDDNSNVFLIGSGSGRILNAPTCGFFMVTNKLPTHIGMRLNDHTFWDMDEYMVKWSCQELYTNLSKEYVGELRDILCQTSTSVGHSCIDEHLLNIICDKITCNVYWFPFNRGVSWKKKVEYSLDNGSIYSLSIRVTGCNCDIYLLTQTTILL